MRLIGLTGTHGSGKTTLIEAFEGQEVVVVKTSISAIYKARGLNPQLPMSLDTRLDVQEEILAHLLKEWATPFSQAADGQQITVLTDRTPMDFVGYLLCEVSGYGELTSYQNARIEAYVTQCISVSHMFDAIIHVPIGLPMVKRDKVSAVDSMGYRMHLDMVMKGAMSHHPQTFSLSGTDHDNRVSQVQAVIKAVTE
ncbi:MAG: AAA family ATPase [Pseudomonas sp.]